MTNLVLLGNIISVLASSPATNFSLVANHAQTKEIALMKENSIDDWDDYYLYLQELEVESNKETRSKGGKGDSSDGIIDCLNHLESEYPDYRWSIDEDNFALTSNVSSFIPIEMQGDFFKKEDVVAAIKEAGIENITSYGGCGPIAMMGILDYFARYLDYKDIIQDPTDESQRIALATEVFKNTHYSIFGNKEATLVWPWDAKDSFNKVVKNHGLGKVISASDHWTLFGGEKKNYWNIVVNNINQGIPVTLFTGLASGNGAFSQHYTNIYGYETWIGTSNTDGTRIEKQFIKARLNWGKKEEYYCDADILNDSQIGLITYKINYSKNYEFYASDFAKDFVNSSGGGQYFFDIRKADVALSNGKTLYTYRQRCSYIENQYLVLSPNRANAGTAFLDIFFPHSLPKLTVDIAMWGDSEDAINEDFKIQYLSNSGWKELITIKPYVDLPTTRDVPKTYTFLFPRYTGQIRFTATHTDPSGNRNKGRIVLDNFIVEYN